LNSKAEIEKRMQKKPRNNRYFGSHVSLQIELNWKTSPVEKCLNNLQSALSKKHGLSLYHNQTYVKGASKRVFQLVG